jgi:hypothetical protein
MLRHQRIYSQKQAFGTKGMLHLCCCSSLFEHQAAHAAGFIIGSHSQAAQITAL